MWLLLLQLIGNKVTVVGVCDAQLTCLVHCPGKHSFESEAFADAHFEQLLEYEAVVHVEEGVLEESDAKEKTTHPCRVLVQGGDPGGDKGKSYICGPCLLRREESI